METSKLPKPSGLRPPVKRTFQLQECAGTSSNAATLSTMDAVPRKMMRRSKSVADLRSNVLRPLQNTLRTLPLTKVNSSVSLKGAKRPVHDFKKPDDRPKVTRPVPTANQKKEAPKPTAPKCLKPAPYDYKARFNLLLEKQGALKAELKESKSQLATYDLLKTEKENATQKVCVLEIQLEAANDEVKRQRETIENYKCENEQLAIGNSKLEASLSKLTRTYDTLFREHEDVKETLKDYHRALATIDELVKLKDRVWDLEQERRVLHNHVQDLKGNIRVFCRVRPALPGEFDRLECNISYANESTMEIRKSRESVSAHAARTNDLVQEFSYDRVFSPRSTQADIFEDLYQLVQSALDGYHVCVFAYGQTGSGKTYTMQGEHESNMRGMIPRSIESLFQRISDLKSSGWEYEVQASFLEIYNENIRDLLDASLKQTHDIRYNEGKGVTVTNLQIEPIATELELKQLMVRAERNRSVATTNYNEHSSRSHAVTKIYLQGVQEESQTVYTGSLNLVDLAGSESAKTTTADRLCETKHINKSLATLGNVMLALRNRDAHVPYRDSKLTYLLQSCLGGDSKTLMIVNIAPFEDCFGESMSSLRFASKVKEVKTNSRRNKTYS